jgi:hypothetical protein
MNQIRAMWGVLRALAPYAAIELIVPGGTVLAILCWLYRRRVASRAKAPAADTARVLVAG